MILTEINTVLKRLILERKTKQIEVARQIGMTGQNLNNLLNKENDKFRLADIDKIANALDYDTKVIFIDRTTGEEIK